MQSPVRFSSCRDVAFEVEPHLDPFAITHASVLQNDPQSNQRSFWFSEETSPKVFPFSSIQRSLSRPSSHFCDLVLDEDEDDNDGDDDFALQRLEQGKVQDEREEKVILPSARTKRSDQQQPRRSHAGNQQSRLSIILLDQGLFTVYKRLFLVCLALNVATLVLAATGHFPYARNKAALFSIGNILALTLCRSEAFLRVIFWLAVKTLGRSWVPLPIKTATTSLLQSLGGIHSGCGVSSIAWLVYALIISVKHRENTSSEIILVAFAILSLLFLSAMAAFPLVRHLHHNVFERTHRFAGWSSLLLLWVFIIFTISYNPKIKSYSTTNLEFSNLIKHQELWFTFAITLLILLPWLTVRRVPVNVSSPSGHAAIIKFENGVKAGILGRISPSPLSEWHAFGIISDGKTEHMMLAGAVGDFTKSLVANPPRHLWVRQVHFAGLPYLANVYERVLLVATGSGICVFLSLLLQPCRCSVSLVWVAKGIEENFGREIKEMVSGFSKEKVMVYDTALVGRPNMSEISVEAAKRCGAQVVIVTSNPQGSRDVVKACKAAGIPAFGPIWDS